MSEIAVERFTFGGTTMKYGRVAGLHLCLHPSTAPSNQDWVDYLRDLEACLTTVHGIFVFTTGGGPNSMQRKQLTALYQAKPNVPSISVTTPSSMVRGIVTAINYFSPRQVKTFRPSEVDQALQHLSADAAEQRLVHAALNEQKVWLNVSAGNPSSPSA